MYGQMKIFFIVVALLSLYVVVDAAKKKPSSEEKEADKAAQRFSALTAKMAASPVVSLTDNTFNKFVVERPRDYHAVLMFTATAKQYQCSVCVRAKTMFYQVAEYYSQQYDFNTTTADERIAFFRIEVDDARNIFGEMQLETVPRVYILPPTTASSPKMKISDYEVESGVLMQSASVALDAITEKTGVKVGVTVSPEPLVFGLCVLAVLLALFVSAAASDVYAAALWYQSPKIWVCVSVVCFCVGVSGSIFCVIKNAPPYGMARTGGLQIFAPQGRDQFFMEGIIVALWTIGCALSYSMLNWATKVRLPLIRHLLVLLSMTMFVVLALQIWQAYIDKTGWYSLRETFPQEVWAYLSGSVKKGSGLPKRLLRMSEYWLYETKDWSSFQKKFAVLVVDYVRREYLGLPAVEK